MGILKFIALMSVMILAACRWENEDKLQQYADKVHRPDVPRAVLPNQTITLKVPDSISSTLQFDWQVLHAPQHSQVNIEQASANSSIFSASQPGIYTVELSAIEYNRSTEKILFHIPVIDQNIHLKCPINSVQNLSIDTQQQAISKDDYISAQLEVAAFTASSYSLNTEIKGRGNSTWQAQKKPYRLKLSKQNIDGLMGLTPARNWALLANAFDRSSLRNASALCLGQNFIRNSWTPQYRFLVLNLNNQSNGLYLLTEHVEVSPHKINLEESSHKDLSFFVEMTPQDRLNSADTYVRTERGYDYEVKSDLSNDSNQKIAQLNQIKMYLDEFEQRLMHSDTSLLSDVLDLDSAVDYLLLNELFKDPDRFWASTHFHKAHASPLRFGPIWDYDLAAGNFSGFQSPTDWLVLEKDYPKLLMQHSLFREKLQQRWEVLYRYIPHLIEYIYQENDNIELAQQANIERWGLYEFTHSFASQQRSYIGDTQSMHVNYLTQWLAERAAWMNTALQNTQKFKP